MNKEDLISDTKMYFTQIKDLTNLILEANNVSMSTILTIHDLSEAGLNLAEKLDKL